MPSCLIGLGSNLGSRHETLDRAVAHLRDQSQMRVVAASRWYETAPVGGPPGQPPFLNGAVLVATSLAAERVLDVLRRIEADLGRHRTERWGPRRIDLDLLLYDQVMSDDPSLVLPHPRMAWRRFVLEPAAEVAASMIHWRAGWAIAERLDHLNTGAPYVAITGSIGVGKTDLARRLASRTSARLVEEELDLQRLEAFYADPAGRAWETELEFLDQRARLLGADLPPWTDLDELVVSDFWFGQSVAFAGVWLPASRQEAYQDRFEQVSRRVVRPKLIVFLDAEPQRLRRQVIRRGRPCEQGLGEEQLGQIGRAILARATRPGQGPVLRIRDDDPQRILDEVLAAVEAMQ